MVQVLVENNGGVSLTKKNIIEISKIKKRLENVECVYIGIQVSASKDKL